MSPTTSTRPRRQRAVPAADSNGHGPTEAAHPFPVDSFREGAAHLRRPFTAQAVKFKVQAVWPKGDPKSALIVSYIDARLAVERLNLVLPHLWFDNYEPPGAKHMVCRLTVDSITRQDVGEGTGKGLYSDALKRAAVKFGVGVSLYAIPKMILEVKDGTVKAKTIGQNKTLEVTPKGDAKLRELYKAWLTELGEQSFGKPLDHGDAEDATGDPDDPAVAPEQPSHVPATDAPRVLTAEERDRIIKTVEDAGYDDKGWLTLLAAVGCEDTDKLTVAHAFEIRELIDAKAGKATKGKSS